jgi:chromosome segregation ATPase
MELVVTFLASISGALIGASVGIYMLFPKLMPDKSELDSVRNKLRNSESSLKTANASIDTLRAQIEKHEQAIQLGADMLKEKQKQLETEASYHAAAERKVDELEAKAHMKAEQSAGADAQAREAAERAEEELRQRVASYQSQLEAGERQIQQLTVTLKEAVAETIELRQRSEQAHGDRATLAEQLGTERTRSQQFLGRIAELQADVLRIENQLQEERQSSASRMDLLVRAQESLSQLVQAAAPAPKAGQNGNGVAHEPDVVTAVH